MSTKFNRILLRDKYNYKIVDDSEFQDETSFLNNIASILNTGVDVLELKFECLPSREVFLVCKKVRELCSYFGALMLVFDRIDVVKLVQADGVVLNNESIPLLEAKKLVEDSFLMGFESFSQEGFIGFDDENVDFIVTSIPYDKTAKKIFLLASED